MGVRLQDVLNLPKVHHYHQLLVGFGLMWQAFQSIALRKRKSDQRQVCVQQLPWD
jgi:hypothetical protein